MKALLLSGYRQLEIVDVPTPQPRPDEVLIRVAACGICGSDVHGYDGSSGRRIPPLVMGHEAAGIATLVGSAVTGISEGDRVTFDSTIFCGACRYCLCGKINLCEKRRVLGVSCGDYSCGGAFAEYIVVPHRIVHHLPARLSFPEAAMLEAVSVALHAAALSQPVPKQTALVVGAGMIGLLTMQALQLAGCSPVYVADVDGSRLEIATRLGAHALLADRQRFATGDIATPKSGHAPDSAAGVLRFCRRVPAGYGAGSQRKNSGPTTHQRRRAARRGAEVVRAIVFPRTGRDEGRPHSRRGLTRRI
jgi:L-iditol 2-dehydrogenase